MQSLHKIDETPLNWIGRNDRVERCFACVQNLIWWEIRPKIWFDNLDLTKKVFGSAATNFPVTDDSLYGPSKLCVPAVWANANVENLKKKLHLCMCDRQNDDFTMVGANSFCFNEFTNLRRM